MAAEAPREIGHYEIELEPIDVPAGNSLDLPYTDQRFFEVTSMPPERQHMIPEGTVGSWRTYLPNEAIFLTEKLQKESAILMISFGQTPAITELAFQVETPREIDDIQVVVSGLAMYLNKDCLIEKQEGEGEGEEAETAKRYKTEETETLLYHAKSRHAANQRAGERDLVGELSRILIQPSPLQ